MTSKEAKTIDKLLDVLYDSYRYWQNEYIEHPDNNVYKQAVQDYRSAIAIVEVESKDI